MDYLSLNKGEESLFSEAESTNRGGRFTGKIRSWQIKEGRKEAWVLGGTGRADCWQLPEGKVS